MTCIYTIRDIIQGETRAYPSLREAISARAKLFPRGHRPDIIRETIADMPRREMLCALFNRSQYRCGMSVARRGDIK